MVSNKEFYMLFVQDVQGYDYVVTGESPKECINKAWKYYKEHFLPDFTSKKEWLEWHGLDETNCRKVTVGDVVTY